jgi:hypothetical protein
MPGQWGRPRSGPQPKYFPLLWHLHSARVWLTLEADTREPSSTFRVAGPRNELKTVQFWHSFVWSFYKTFLPVSLQQFFAHR